MAGLDFYKLKKENGTDCAEMALLIQNLSVSALFSHACTLVVLWYVRDKAVTNRQAGPRFLYGEQKVDN